MPSDDLRGRVVMFTCEKPVSLKSALLVEDDVEDVALSAGSAGADLDVIAITAPAENQRLACLGVGYFAFSRVVCKL